LVISLLLAASATAQVYPRLGAVVFRNDTTESLTRSQPWFLKDTARIAGHVWPNTTLLHDLGADSLKWRYLFARTGRMDSLWSDLGTLSLADSVSIAYLLSVGGNLSVTGTASIDSIITALRLTSNLTVDGTVSVDTFDQAATFLSTINTAGTITLTNTGDAGYVNVQGVSDGDNFSGLSLKGAGTQQWQFANKSSGDFNLGHNNGTSWSFPFTITAGDTVEATTNLLDVSGAGSFGGDLDALTFDGFTLRQGAALSDTAKFVLYSDTTSLVAMQWELDDKVTKARTLTVAANAPLTSSAGAQDLSANRTWTLSADTSTATTGLTTLYQNSLKVNTSALGSMAYVDSTTYHGSASINTVGTIGTGTWQGTSIDTTYTNAVSRITATLPIVATSIGKGWALTAGGMLTGFDTTRIAFIDRSNIFQQSQAFLGNLDLNSNDIVEVDSLSLRTMVASGRSVVLGSASFGTADSVAPNYFTITTTVPTAITPLIRARHIANYLISDLTWGLYGVWGEVEIDSASVGDVLAAQGLYGYVNNFGQGTLNNADGVRSIIAHRSNDTIRTVRGFNYTFYSDSSGVTTNDYGVLINTPILSATSVVSDNRAIYVADQVVAGIPNTNNYAIYTGTGTVQLGDTTNINVGVLQMAGTTAIDASRNATLGTISGSTETLSGDLTLQGARTIKNNVNTQSLTLVGATTGTKGAGITLAGGAEANEGQIDILFGTRDSTAAQQETEFRIRFNNGGTVTQLLDLFQDGNLTLGATRGTGTGGIAVDTVKIGATTIIDASRNLLTVGGITFSATGKDIGTPTVPVDTLNVEDITATGVTQTAALRINSVGSLIDSAVVVADTLKLYIGGVAYNAVKSESSFGLLWILLLGVGVYELRRRMA